MKKILAVLTVLCMLMSVCCAFAEDLQTVALGLTGLSISFPADYVEGEISEKDTDESQIAYYYSENCLVDFDVYQWVKATGETLADAANEEAVEYESEAVETEINGLPFFYYNAVEESEGTEYNTATYLTENGDYILEIVFWLDGENPEAVVESILSTISVDNAANVDDGGTVISLGSSAICITLPVAYQQGEISEEDTDESQVAYYYSDESLIDFDVYQWAIADGETLESAATEEAAEYGAEIEMRTFGDIEFACYTAVEESDGNEYQTYTCMAQDGEYFVEVVFWLDGDDPMTVVESVLATAAR